MAEAQEHLTVENPNQANGHPSDPRSNIAKIGAYDPEKYAITQVSPTVVTNEALLQNQPPCLTQKGIGMYLKPLTRELDEVPPCPKTNELPDSVINRMVFKDLAFWVDKPGANAYTLHDAFYNYNMQTMVVKPTPQAVFPRSYQYDLDCVKYRRAKACRQIPLSPECRDCTVKKKTTQGPQAWAEDSGSSRRWKNYPDLSTPLSVDEVRTLMMFEVGRPFQSEACNWYNKNYPSEKYDVIVRRFSK